MTLSARSIIGSVVICYFFLPVAKVHARQSVVPGSASQVNASPAPVRTIDLEAPSTNQKLDLPQWAFTPNPPRKGPRLPDDGALLHVPGSLRAYTRTQINDGSNPPDWFPDEHPAMPKPVAHGGSGYRACAECHLANGRGKPDTAALNALPAAYIEQQMEDFSKGRRHASVPGMSVRSMLPVAVNITPAETKEAAEYFASIPPAKWILVVETDVVPRTEFAGYRFVALAEGGTEPIGNRIVELPVDADRTTMRDATSGFIAYVPRGSIAKGKMLVETGAGKTTGCVLCHGKDLHGMGAIIPSIAGRSPSSMGRQIYDFKTGARDGSNASLMKAPVANLDDADIVNIVSYLSSLPQ